MKPSIKLSRKLATTVITTAALFTGVATQAQAPAKAALCGACHGPNGDKPIMDAYPKIAGQNKAYLEAALKAYKAGQRSGGMAPVMTGQAKALSDADISALAEYYSKL